MDWLAFVSAILTGVSVLVVLKKRQARRFAAVCRLREIEQNIRAAISEWNFPDGKDQYLTQPQYCQWVSRYTHLIDELIEISPLLTMDSLGVEVRELMVLGKRGNDARIARNELWVNRQREKHECLFAKGIGYSLNADQINAILHDEHRTLVVAGAGTGKTSTIVAKARWILAQGLADPSRIRILAFNKKAAEEIKERLGGEMATNGVSGTFHSLGLGVVAQARGKKPRLTPLDEDKRLMQAFIRRCIDDGLKTPNVANHVIEFLAYFRYPEPNPVPHEKSHEANRWAEGHDIRSLTGVLLRSNSEVIIANWLTLNSIEWRYEQAYELDTASIRFGQYRPDFFLPEYGIYIEHWACNRNGQLPSSWSPEQQAQYREGMAWKRDLHIKQSTALVETYSDINGQRAIIESLERALISLGVKPIPLGKDKREALVMTDEVISPVVTLTQNFLKLYRESGTSLRELREKLERKQSARDQAFLDMFEWIHDRYVDQIKSEGAIDFSDMIREAAESLRTTKAELPLDYLLVDEFQDISRGRAQLVKAILEQNPNCRLVAVGDDWQSINRFAGSDIQVMVEFQQEFGFTKRTDLQQTHRFGSKLLEATSHFIQKNPQQLKKSLVAAHTDLYPAIEIISTESTGRSLLKNGVAERTIKVVENYENRLNSNDPFVETDLQRIGENAEPALGIALSRIADNDDTAKVLVLGRYNFLKQQLDEVTSPPPGLTIEFSTVHRAKGREADYVVVLDVVAGRYGFPSEIEDDPIMHLVLADQAGYPNAEERRVFYVALTRSRIKSYILTDDHRRSGFIDELEGHDYDNLVIGSGAANRVANCPICKSGRLQRRTGPYGQFYVCASRLCNGKAAKCPYCGAGGFIRGSSNHTCLFCGKTSENCPKCTSGYLKHIPGGVSSRGVKYQAFDACSTNRSNPQYRCFVRNPCGCPSESA